MPYTVTDYYRDFIREHLNWLTPEERLEGIELKKRIQGMPSDDILRTLFPDETGEHVDAAKLERHLQSPHPTAQSPPNEISSSPKVLDKNIAL